MPPHPPISNEIPHDIVCVNILLRDNLNPLPTVQRAPFLQVVYIKFHSHTQSHGHLPLVYIRACRDLSLPLGPPYATYLMFVDIEIMVRFYPFLGELTAQG